MSDWRWVMSSAVGASLPAGMRSMTKPEERGEGGALQSASPLHPELFQRSVHQGAPKIRGNVVNPDEIVDFNGADAPRSREMLVGPLKAVKPWQTSQVLGVTWFQNKAHNVIHNAIEFQAAEMDKETARLLHEKVAEDAESLNFNRAIFAMMVCHKSPARPQGKRPAGGHRETSFDDVFLPLLLIWVKSAGARWGTMSCWRVPRGSSLTVLLTTGVRVNGKTRGDVAIEWVPTKRQRWPLPRKRRKSRVSVGWQGDQEDHLRTRTHFDCHCQAK